MRERLIIKFTLCNAKMTQHKLAVKIGVKPIDIRRFIAGKNSLSKKQITKLLKELKLNMCQIDNTETHRTNGVHGCQPFNY